MKRITVLCFLAAFIAFGGCQFEKGVQSPSVSSNHDFSLEQPRLWIVTGGQSGVDRAAMDVALEYGLPLRGWCPKNRWAEDGAIAPHYPLQETPSGEPEQRTLWNVRDSDGTLILCFGELVGGTYTTANCAAALSRPVFVADLGAKPDLRAFQDWISKNNIRILNVAGPRESYRPGEVYKQAKLFLETYLK